MQGAGDSRFHKGEAVVVGLTGFFEQFYGVFSCQFSILTASEVREDDVESGAETKR